jgi:OOP family OmpA-OmpF porin
MKKRNLMALVLAGTLAAPAASSLAATREAPSFYVGAGIGYFQAEEQEFFEQDIDDEEVSYKLYAGGNFLPWLGAEAGWVSFGEVGDAAGRFESDGWTIAALTYLPLQQPIPWAPYLKVGQYFWDADRSFTGGSVSDDGNDLFGGIGAQFELTEVVDLRVEYERYQIDDADIDSAWVNAQLRF